ncbi:ribonuclease HIII [Fructobacillus ficulneus]|uniref:Ribonuclease HIII n=1 Tax=Fructobacillus ficulneus TaxID=157463 RepID=A0A0K8MHR8_9LACO|nr:ribonuclease HIII [Fructobacillus ficulneus]GAO99738.1 ribonuclease HIII [Fructobacillus ficulneus]
MQSVLTLDSATISKCRTYYARGMRPQAPNGAVFQAQNQGTTITAYRSGKVLFQGPNAETEALRWQGQSQPNLAGTRTTSSAKPSYKKPKEKPGANLPTDFAKWSVIGSDEVGAGAYFGPLTTAAVYVPESQLAWVKSLGIADSKTLTDDKIKTIAPQIIQKLPHHVVNLMPDKYNQLQESGQNVVAMKALSHNFVLNTVREKIAPTEPAGYLVDQFVSPNSYFKYLQTNHQDPIVRQNVYFTTKGETFHLAVAAASILARYVELQSMAELSQAAGLTLPIGAGKEADRIAAKLINQGTDLRHYAKLHFANTQKAQNLAHR